MSHTETVCSHCGEDAKCRRREFSEQAWAALLVWGEVQATLVDQAICEECYAELREVLIDRADEIEAAASGQTNERKTAQAGFAKETAAAAKGKKPAKQPEPARQKVRKAS